MREAVAGLLLLASGMILPVTPARAEPRFALLVGNKDYLHVAPLKNPLNDINLVNDSLSKDRFSVNPIQNANSSKLLNAVDDFAEKLGNAGDGALGVFYYSGHGLTRQQDHRFYFIPTDSADSREARDNTFWNAAVPLSEIQRRLQESAPNATIFIIIDACREELRLPDRSKSPSQNSKSFERPTDRADGVVIVFSTRPGRTSSDIGEEGGPFARALARQLLAPVEQHVMFRKVAVELSIETKGQRPYIESDLLPIEIYFSQPDLSSRKAAELQEQMHETKSDVPQSKEPGKETSVPPEGATQKPPAPPERKGVHNELDSEPPNPPERVVKVPRQTPPAPNPTGLQIDSRAVWRARYLNPPPGSPYGVISGASYGVVVASGFASDQSAFQRLRQLCKKFPEVEFALLGSYKLDGSNPQLQIEIGYNLRYADAKALALWAQNKIARDAYERLYGYDGHSAHFQGCKDTTGISKVVP